MIAGANGLINVINIGNYYTAKSDQASKIKTFLLLNLHF